MTFEQILEGIQELSHVGYLAEEHLDQENIPGKTFR